MTNTRNTPIEYLENSYPFMITSYRIRDNSGGDGKFRGGDGIVREYKFNLPCQVSVLSERRKNRPYGLGGGSPGKSGENLYLNGATGEMTTLPGKFTMEVKPGDHLIIKTPGGGGWGAAPSCDTDL